MPLNIMCMLCAAVWLDHFEFASYGPALTENRHCKISSLAKANIDYHEQLSLMKWV